MWSRMLVLVFVAAASFRMQAARPDVVYFAKGYIFEAKVTDKGDKWLLAPVQDARIRLPASKLVDKAEVDRVVFEEDFRTRLDAKLNALPPDDLQGRQALIAWCHDEHFTSCARKLAQDVFQVVGTKADREASADALYEAGAWVLEAPQKYYLPRKAGARLLERALEIDPDHERAHRALKHKKLQDRWVSEAEYRKLTRAPRKRPRRTPRKKEAEDKPPIWQAVLAGALPFKVRPEEAVRVFGKPSVQQTRTSEGGEEGYVNLTYREGPVETTLEFQNGKFTLIRSTCRRRDDPDHDRFYLDGAPMSRKERAKALKRMLSNRRVAFGMTRREVLAVMGRPLRTERVQVSGGFSSDPSEWWIFSALGDRHPRLHFANDSLVEIGIYCWAF